MGYVDEVLADSPTALWQFEESNGNLTDSVGSYTAIASGVAYNAQGPKGGKAVFFDGVNDSLTVNSFPDFIANGTYTFEVWVKFGSQASDYPTFCRRDGNGKAWLVRTRGPATGSRINELESYHSGQTVMTSPATFSDDQWHHVVMTSVGNAGTLYVDGVAYANRNGAVSGGGTGTAAPFYLGRGDGSIEFFKGYMAYPAVYPTALSDTRIRAHYNAVESSPPKAVLSGLTNTLIFSSLQGPTIALGAFVTPPMEVLAGHANSLSLDTLLGPTIVKGATVVPPKTLRTGTAGKLALNELGMTLFLTEPATAELLGEWFLEVIVAEKSLQANNPTASQEVRNARKRVTTELKTLVRA